MNTSSDFLFTKKYFVLFVTVREGISEKKKQTVGDLIPKLATSLISRSVSECSPYLTELLMNSIGPL